MQEIINWMLVWQASYTGLLVEVILIFLIFLSYKFAKNGWFSIFFELIFEKAYEFFEDILWKEEQKWIKMYIITMFFIILLSNLTWTVLDFIIPTLSETNKEHFEHFIKIPSSDINFNIAMAIIWVLIVIMEQFKTLGFTKTLYEYFPIFWKNLIPFEKGKLPFLVDNLVYLIVKIFDIVISLFLWILDVVWHLAKIISLSFRLFWNMTSGWLLLAMLFAGLIWATSFIGSGFPIIGPVILYMQWLLVALIQALVFPLLIAIFIKVAKVH